MENLTELCEIAYKYGSDKCPRLNHVYTPFYYELLKDRRQSIKKVLEMGIGGRRITKVIPHYQIGASLRMWRDFFPNAQIYGADIDSRMLFEDERIKTFFCDERVKEDIEKLVKQTGSDIDLFIDDANHYTRSQIFLCQTIMPLLKKDVIYIIEDVGYSRKLTKALNQYECETPLLIDRKLNEKNANKLLIVKNK